MNDLIDPYVAPGTDVLRNKLGLKSAPGLHQAEYELTQDRGEELHLRPTTGRFDLAHMKEIHAHLFQDVYDWAGQARSIDISKGTTSFTKARHIEPIAERLAQTLAQENYLRGLPKDKFVDRLAHHYAQWNALHPFREGNGRTTRVFIGQLAGQAGYELDQTRIDKVKFEFNRAAKLSFEGDMAPIKAVFADAIRPARAAAFEKLPEREAVAKHPELQAAFDGLRAIARALEDKYPNNPRAQAHFAAQARSETLRKLDAGQQLKPAIERAAIAPSAQRSPGGAQAPLAGGEPRVAQARQATGLER